MTSKTPYRRRREVLQAMSDGTPILYGPDEWTLNGRPVTWRMMTALCKARQIETFKPGVHTITFTGRGV